MKYYILFIRFKDLIKKDRCRNILDTIHNKTGLYNPDIILKALELYKKELEK